LSDPVDIRNHTIVIGALYWDYLSQRAEKEGFRLDGSWMITEINYWLDRLAFAFKKSENTRGKFLDYLLIRN